MWLPLNKRESEAVKREATNQLEDLHFEPHVLVSVKLSPTSVGDEAACRSQVWCPWS